VPENPNVLARNLPNFVQFKQYQGKSGHGVPRVILFKARFTRISSSYL